MNQEQLRAKLDQVIWNIEKARLKVSEHHIVNIVAVGKYTEIENIEMLYHLGQRTFGENQVQQLSHRAQELDSLPIEWHMIGTLQKNKINKLIDTRPALFQALDSLELAQALHQRLDHRGERMECLLQINSAREETKSGVDPDEAIEIYHTIMDLYPTIGLRGVMTIGAHTDDTDVVRQSFQITHDIFTNLQNTGANICSMGMSNDYELAIECGSNMVRVGSAIFK